MIWVNLCIQSLSQYTNRQEVTASIILLPETHEGHCTFRQYAHTEAAQLVIPNEIAIGFWFE